jgi:tripartite ATP-independent transporter DctM subunit
MIPLAISFTLFMVMGLPIAFVLGASSLVYILSTGNWNTLLVLTQKIYQGTDDFILLSIPFYLLAGELMNATGITQRLIGFFIILMGHIRGALAQVNVVAGMFFSAISGTATSDAAAVGGVMIPAMIKQGYKPEFAAALQAATATIAPIIPPSMVMIIYAVFANVSVAAMFAAGIIPGLLLGLSQMGLVYYYARSGKLPPANVRATRQEIQIGFKDATLAFLMPIIILGGIFSGVFTTTEAAAAAVLYAIVVGFFVYRSLTISRFAEILVKTAVSTGGLLLIAATGNLFGWILAAEQVPAKAAELILFISDNPWVFLLLVNILLLLLGTFMDTLPALIICVPVLFPVSQQLGVDPVHFGVIVCFNIIQGMLTPPVGLLLFITAQIAKVRFEAVTRAVIPFLIINTVVLFAITFIPGFVLFLPRLMGLIQ